MLWRESGGPPVTTPRRRGFGDAVLVSMVEQGLDAEVALSYPPDGPTWQMSAPAGCVLDQAGTPIIAAGRGSDATDGGLG